MDKKKKTSKENHDLFSPQCEYCLASTKRQPDYDGRYFCCEDCRIKYRKLKIKTPFIGEHMVSPRKGYIHHGIGDNKGGVLHYSGFAEAAEAGPVARTTFDEFCQGKRIYVLWHKHRKYTLQDSVKRAEKRLGEEHYDLPSNNCEHFVNWCIEGKIKSRQVERVAAYATGISVFATAILVLDIYAATGATAVGSYLLFPRMSGVKYGSGLLLILSGIGLISGTAIAAALSYSILRDRPWLAEGEKRSRRVARHCAFGTVIITVLLGLMYKWFIAEQLVHGDLAQKFSPEGLNRFINISLFVSAGLPPVLATVISLSVHYFISRKLSDTELDLK